MDRPNGKTFVLLGSTGLTGSHLLTELLKSKEVAKVETISRRAPQLPETLASSSQKLQTHISADTTAWPSLLRSTIKSPAPVSGLISGLSAMLTRDGGQNPKNSDAWKKIDIDLQYELAKTAKEAGVETYALISGANCDPDNWLGEAFRAKGRLNDDIVKLGFKRTVIVKPGMILGDRSGQERGYGEIATIKIIGGIKAVLGAGAVASIGNDVGSIARATVKAVLAEGDDFKGDANGVWVLMPRDIYALGG